MIPLVYSAGGEYFRDSGRFVVTFTVNADINTVITKTRGDAPAVLFTDGSGTVDLSSGYGYFSGGLVNPADTAAPEEAARETEVVEKTAERILKLILQKLLLPPPPGIRRRRGRKRQPQPEISEN
jgi:hypothetical protein